MDDLARGSQVASKKSVNSIQVFCAASLRVAMEDIRMLYEEENETLIQVTYGSSGQLEASLRMNTNPNQMPADLYIPADKLFSHRTDSEGLTKETIEFARQQVVLAFDNSIEQHELSLTYLLNDHLRFSLCDPSAGAGLQTKLAFSKVSRWDEISRSSDVIFPSVTEAANAIKNSSGLQAGFIWDTTARQFQLDFVALPELIDAFGSVTVSLVSSSTNLTEAKKFMEYLTDKDGGMPYFQKHYFRTESH